ncbi:glycosyltransferase family 2 protein [Leucobacter manosquensis]|uniref:4,4'-diaponeurosporenoate glycosyltransferase n=1 Tax=Leucobacter manosquensis TaxID=2810611 RepID=A0ABS5M7Y1_9MICO|nr:glycosyltransferase family 2 protein [Leucobacter manosquensis]
MDGDHDSTVSVVIPVKDDAPLLARCLRALAEQTRAPHEIIVVDNNSQDDSARVARDAGATVVPCAAPGIPAASATGYDAASSDYVLRLDADCLPEPTWIATFAGALDARRDVAVVTGGAHFVDGPKPLRRIAAAIYLGMYVATTSPALGHSPVFGSNLGFRRSAWLAVRDEVHLHAGIHDDLDLAYHFGERHRIRRVRTPVMGMSMRPLSSVGGFARRTAWAFRTVLLHWPADFPSVRWIRLALRRVLHRLGVPTPRAARTRQGRA